MLNTWKPTHLLEATIVTIQKKDQGSDISVHKEQDQSPNVHLQLSEQQAQKRFDYSLTLDTASIFRLF
jgi:hypothetical protein